MNDESFPQPIEAFPDDMIVAWAYHLLVICLHKGLVVLTLVRRANAAKQVTKDSFVRFKSDHNKLVDDTNRLKEVFDSRQIITDVGKRSKSGRHYAEFTMSKWEEFA